MKSYTHRSKSSKNWNPTHWVPLDRFFLKPFNTTQCKKSFTVSTFKLNLLSNNNSNVRIIIPMWGILILANILSIGYKLSCCGSLWSEEDFLFKSILGRRCESTKVGSTGRDLQIKKVNMNSPRPVLWSLIIIESIAGFKVLGGKS